MLDFREYKFGKDRVQRYDNAKKCARNVIRGMDYDELRTFCFSVVVSSKEAEKNMDWWENVCEKHGLEKLVSMINEYFNRDVL